MESEGAPAREDLNDVAAAHELTWRERHIRRAKSLMKLKRIDQAERLIIRLGITGSLPFSLVDFYRSQILKRRLSQRASEIILLPGLGDLDRRLLTAVALYNEGLTDDAIAQLTQHPPSDVRKDRARLSEIQWFLCREAERLEEALAHGRAYLRDSRKLEFRFALGLAALAERLGNAAAFKSALGRAMRDADTARERPEIFHTQYGRLVHTYMRLFDYRTAREIATSARRKGLPGSKGLQREVLRIEADISLCRQLYDDAQQDLCFKAQGVMPKADREAIEIIVSTAALGFQPHDNRYFRKSVRDIYRLIWRASRETGRPVRVRAKLESRTALQPSNRCVISYHTTGTDDRALHWKEAYQPGSFTLNRYGFAGWSDLARKRLEELALSDISQSAASAHRHVRLRTMLSTNSSKYRQAERGASASLAPGYVFLGLQILNDSVQQLANVPMLQMLDEVSETCRERGLRLIVKRHPLCRSKAIGDRIKRGLEAGEFVTSTASVHELIQGACAVCVVNSGVGLEALFHQKPVFVFGKSDYWHVCYRMKQPGDFRAAFEPYRLPVDEATMDRFLFYFDHLYLIDVSRFRFASAIRNRVLHYIRNRLGADSEPMRQLPYQAERADLARTFEHHLFRHVRYGLLVALAEMQASLFWLERIGRRVRKNLLQPTPVDSA